MRFPVRVRLTLWYTSVLLVILAAVGGVAVALTRANLVKGVDDSLTARAQVIAQLSRSGPVLPNLGLQEVVAQIVTVDGTIVQRAGESVPSRSLIDRSATVRVFAHPVYATVRVSGVEFRVTAIPLQKDRTVLVVGRELDEVHRAVRGLVLILLLAAPIAVALAAGGGWLLARAALRPVDVMTQTAASVDAVGRHDPIPVPATEDELSRLARTLNEMLDRLHGALEEERRFSADASHELRTPLGIMAAELDVAMRSKSTPDVMQPTLASLREEVMSLSRIVENLFLLARLDDADRVVLERRRVDLLDVAAQVADRYDRTAAERGIDLRVDGSSATVDADPESVSQVIANLVDNALKYTEAGGTVRVSINGDSSNAILTVADTGIGIAPQELAHVFDRFYRVDRARSRRTGGAGLGLAIVQRLVQAHGGRVDAESHEGSGTSFTVRMPRATR